MTPWLLRHNSGALDGAPESYVNRIVDTGDGFAIATSYDYTHVTKVDYAGNIQWQFTDINTYEAVVGADTSGNVFVLDHARLTKISAAGVVQWQKSTSTGFIAQPELAVLADGSCLVISGNTNTLLRIAKFSSTGLLTFEKTYTGTDEVVNATKVFFENGAGDLFHFTTGTFGDDYLRLTKHNSALAITWTKSYKTTAKSYDAKSSCKLSDGSMAVGFLDSSTLGTLRLARVAEDGTVTWSKSVTDSNVTSFFTNGFTLHSGGTGFYVHSRAAAGPLLYRLDSTGALEWARIIAHPTVAGGWMGSVVATADGVLVAASPLDVGSNAIASCFYLRSDGTPVAEFAGATAEVTNWTGVSVAAGDTLTVATDSDSAIATTAGTVTTNAADVASSSYALQRYYADSLQAKQASGSLLPKFGSPTSPYDQVGAALGSRNTEFGIAASFSVAITGTTICNAIGSRLTKFGSATDNSSATGQASGSRTTHFGTCQSRTTYAATGVRGTQFGSAKGAVITYAQGTRATKYGTPTGLVVGVASGVHNTRFGQAVAEWGNTGTASGSRNTHFGSAGSLSKFIAICSYKTRYGTAKTIRSVPC